ncbi:MAG: peptidoglycan recognition family protein [Kofleriaceae bacterium]
MSGRAAVVLAAALVGGCRERAPAPAVEPPRDAPVTATDARAAGVDAAAPDAMPTATIVDWPIPWPPERAALMLDYRRAHEDPAATDLTIRPTTIVLHYTAGGSAKGTHRYFSRTEIEPGRAALRAAGVVNVSAHFLVDRDGTIFRLVPEDRMARHCIGLNHNSIGVENVGDEDRWPLTDAQIEANAQLVRHLVARWPITRLIGHYEARLLDGTPAFVERDPSFRNRKPDPGPRFMEAVRARVADLGLDGAPAP